MRISARQLRAEVAGRNLRLAADLPHECTCSRIPSVLFQAREGTHGNFLPASYRRIAASRDWSKRLRKHYAASASLPRWGDRVRRELDCANSSDALLMNIFCYPGVTSRRTVCALMGIVPGSRPKFGVRSGTPLVNGSADRTEIDMVVGNLFVEAKLTESGFQSARPELVLRYKDIDTVFDIAELPMRAGKFESYQLIRGIMAAQYGGSSFLLICDGRRADLAEDFFRVVRAVRGCDLRSRCALLVWQELCLALPTALQTFLMRKYGISASG